MERDYKAMCAQDGWERIRDEHARPFAASGTSSEPGSWDIPPDSDYFQTSPAVREVCARVAPGVASPLLLPARPPRNLDELRRVETATQEAMEKERQRYAEMRAKKAVGDPIRTRSEVVRVDTLSDSEEDVHDENLEATLNALAEFDRLGREKDARLAKWRDRWG